MESGTRLGPYEIIEQLGAGGMGEVCRARDTRLDRDMAITQRETSSPVSLRCIGAERTTSGERAEILDLKGRSYAHSSNLPA